MKKTVIIAMLLVVMTGSLFALGHIGVSNKGISSLTVTWKDGIADGVNIDAGFSPDGIYVGGQYHFIDQPLADLKWFDWYAGAGASGVIGTSGGYFGVYGDVVVGLEWYPGILSDINLPLEIFTEYGIGIGLTSYGLGTNFMNYGAGIRWMFD